MTTIVSLPANGKPVWQLMVAALGTTRSKIIPSQYYQKACMVLLFIMPLIAVGIVMAFDQSSNASKRLTSFGTHTSGQLITGSANQQLTVDPFIFDEIQAKGAYDLNRAVPFKPLGPDKPLPFRIASGTANYDRALDCLASALVYEAGDDPEGQAAVAQVVVNRLRHPAFPHSVCAVIYQGADRATGCQFTFTYDGALHCAPSTIAWSQARQTAAAFLTGRTDPTVGMATHYHTDKVHPYWSDTLDKIAQVGTHLFFRWHGSWGRRNAFSAPYTGVELAQPKLAYLSIAHRATVELLGLPTSTPAVVQAEADWPRLSTRTGDHLITVDTGGDGSKLALEGLSKCSGQEYCKVVGWDRRSHTHGSPQNPVLQTVAFLYVSDKRTGVEIVLWDCARFNRPADSQCLSDGNRRWITFQGDFSHAS